LGTGFAYASAAPRLLFSLGENTEVLRPLLKLNRFGVSTFTIIFTLVAECLAFILLPNLKMMIAILVAAFVLCYTVAPASLLVLRKTEPELKRPFRVFAAPIVSYLSIFFSNIMVFSCGWIALRNLSVFAMGLMALLLVLQRGSEGSKQFKGCLWFLFQLFAILGLSYLDHMEPLAFPTMFFSVAGISAVSLYFASLGRLIPSLPAR
jgi:amino acid transporter